MTAIRELLDRCVAAGVRLTVKDPGTLRYEAPRGIDPGLKAELRKNKPELLRHLSVRAIETKDPWRIQSAQPLTIMTVAGGERMIRVLPAGSPIVPDCVLFVVGRAAYWTPGPAHALGSQ